MPKAGLAAAIARYGDRGLSIDEVPAKDGGNFLKFSSPQAGLAAIPKLLTSFDGGYRDLSVENAMRKWSNKAYGATILPGVKPDTLVKDLSPAQLNDLAVGITHREGWNENAFAAKALQNGEQKMAPLYEYMGFTFNDPVYLNGTPGYQRDVRAKAYEERVAPFYINQGLVPPDKDLFINSGEITKDLTPMHSGAEASWFKYGFNRYLSATTKNIRGLLEDLPHAIDNLLMQGEAKSRANNAFVENRKSFDGLIGALDNWADNNYSHSWKQAVSGFAGSTFADLPIFWATGSASELVSGMVANGKTIEFLTRRAIDFGEGYLYGRVKGDEAPSTTGIEFLMGNPVARGVFDSGIGFVNKMVANVGSPNFKGAVSKTVTTLGSPAKLEKLSPEESEIIDFINETMQMRKPTVETYLKKGNRAGTKTVVTKPDVADMELHLEPEQLGSFINKVRAQAQVAGFELGAVPREILYSNYALLNDISKEVHGPNALAFPFLNAEQKTAVLIRLGEHTGNAVNVAPANNSEAVRVIIQQDVVSAISKNKAVGYLLGQNPAEAVEQMTQEALDTNAIGVGSRPPEHVIQEIERATLPITKAIAGPGAANINDPQFLTNVLGTVSDFMFNNTNIKIENPEHRLLFLRGLGSDIPKEVRGAVNVGLSNIADVGSKVIPKGSGPEVWDTLSRQLDEHLSKLTKGGEDLRVAKHGVTRMFRSTNLPTSPVGSPTKYQRDLNNIIKGLGINPNVVDALLGSVKTMDTLGLLKNKNMFRTVTSEVDKSGVADKVIQNLEQLRQRNAQMLKEVKQGIENMKPGDTNAASKLLDMADQLAKNNADLRNASRFLQTAEKSVGVIRLRPDGKPILWLSNKAMRVLMEVTGQDASNGVWLGVNLSGNPENLIRIANKLKYGLVSDTEVGTKLARLIDHYRVRNSAKGASGGVTIVRAGENLVGTYREETTHEWQTTLGQGFISKHLSPSQYNDLHKFALENHLLKNLGKSYDIANPEQAVIELGAKLIAGQGEQLNISKSQARDFLKKYIQAIKATHGADAFEHLSFASRFFWKVFDEETSGRALSSSSSAGGVK